MILQTLYYYHYYAFIYVTLILCKMVSLTRTVIAGALQAVNVFFFDLASIHIRTVTCC